ncbi:MAG TPA: hypothetical protein VG845_04745, partial [Dehalococcoidia bacterium]|nr:hypothetical protein [Dehalococcoidia bacterium]
MRFFACTLGTALFAINLLAFVAEAPPVSSRGDLHHEEPARADDIRQHEPSWPAQGITPPGMLPEAQLTPRTGDDLLALRAEMAKAIGSYTVSGKYAVAVTDLQTGETTGVNEKTPHLSGCVANLFLLLEVVRRIDTGDLQLAAADRLIAATTWSSNAATARDLYVLLGKGDATEGTRAVNQLIDNVLELDGVVLDRPPGYAEYSLGLDYNNSVTAAAI